MALSEKRVLRSVEILPEIGIAQVLWVDQVLRDTEVIAETNFRCAYSVDEKAEFLALVENGEHYVVPLGWTD